MSDTYDVVVVGAGPAGYVCAIRAAQLGLRTACVESGSYEGGLGGTCLNWGCIPAKALLESAALAHNLQHHGARMGVKPVEVEYDFSAAVKRSRIITRKLTAGVKYLLGKNKVEIVQGRGRLAGAGRVAIETEDGEDHEIATRNVVFATGSVMKTFPGFELDGEKVIGSREALGLQELPAKMAIVGAGFVGVEFADVFNAFGVDVTLIEALDTLVPLEDPEIGKALERSFKKRGIRNLTNTRVKHLDRDASPMVLTVVNPDGSETAEETDLVLMAVGRRPVTENLDLEKNGVAVEDGFIRIDEWCRTNQPGVYAIGDIVAGSPEQMVAVLESDAAAGVDMAILNIRPDQGAAEVARFVGLQVDDDDIERLEAEARSVARNMARLDAIDLDGVEPLLIHFLPPSQPR